jgi:hypothetical protein
MKHIATSEWKIWWTGDDSKELKLYSNLLSGVLYLSILLIFLLIVILKVNII